MADAHLSADGWEPALAAALMGADRAPPAADEVFFADGAAGGDAAGALLARLAAHGVHRIAGASLTADALECVPERPVEGPECPPAAALRLVALLTDGYHAGDRVTEWCVCAAAAGVRAPNWLLPMLAAYARQHDEAAAGIRTVAGPELAWLARACGKAPDGTDGSAAGAAAEDWQAGTWQERRAAFAAFRRRDPEAARLALEAGFKREKAQIREHLVAAMDVGLSAADEPFLEACLDDRAGGVRLTARNRLLLLRGSRLAGRMAERARAALAIETGPAGEAKLAVTLPEESSELARDGIEPPAYNKTGGRRAALLGDIIACAPLDALGDHPPRLWIEGALRSTWTTQLFDGLYASMRSEENVEWVRAAAATLADAWAGRIEGVRRTGTLLEMWARAVALLPGAEWEEIVGALLRARQIETVIAMLGTGPSTLSEPFTGLVLDWLALVTRGSESLRHDLGKAWIIGGLQSRLHPGEVAAGEAAVIVARLPDNTQAHLRQQLASLAEALELRAAIRREFA